MEAGRDDNERVPAALPSEPGDKAGLAPSGVWVWPDADDPRGIAEAAEPVRGRPARVEPVRDHEHRRHSALDELERVRQPPLLACEHDHRIGLRHAVVVVEDEERDARDGEGREGEQDNQTEGPPHDVGDYGERDRP